MKKFTLPAVVVAWTLLIGPVLLFGVCCALRAPFFYIPAVILSLAVVPIVAIVWLMSLGERFKL